MISSPRSRKRTRVYTGIQQSAYGCAQASEHEKQGESSFLFSKTHSNEKTSFAARSPRVSACSAHLPAPSAASHRLRCVFAGRPVICWPKHAVSSSIRAIEAHVGRPERSLPARTGLISTRTGASHHGLCREQRRSSDDGADPATAANKAFAGQSAALAICPRRAAGLQPPAVPAAAASAIATATGEIASHPRRLMVICCRATPHSSRDTINSKAIRSSRAILNNNSSSISAPLFPHRHASHLHLSLRWQMARMSISAFTTTRQEQPMT